MSLDNDPINSKDSSVLRGLADSLLHKAGCKARIANTLAAEGKLVDPFLISDVAIYREEAEALLKRAQDLDDPLLNRH